MADSTEVDAHRAADEPGAGDDVKARTGAQAVQRALAILDCFRTAPATLGITDLARATGLNASTVHRIVRALCDDDFIEQDPVSDRYRLGAAVVVLGQRAMETSGFARAQPILDRLATSTGESASLAVRRGHEVVVMAHTASTQALRFEHPTGGEIQIHASAMGKALLAFSGETLGDTAAALPPLGAFTSTTISDTTLLVAELERIRRDGFATNREERYEGVAGVAAPVLDRSGRAHAAVGVQGPRSRLDDGRLLALGASVVDAARAVAELLGFDS